MNYFVVKFNHSKFKPSKQGNEHRMWVRQEHKHEEYNNSLDGRTKGDKILKY